MAAIDLYLNSRKKRRCPRYILLQALGDCYAASPDGFLSREALWTIAWKPFAEGSREKYNSAADDRAIDEAVWHANKDLAKFYAPSEVMWQIERVRLDGFRLVRVESEAAKPVPPPLRR